MMSELENKLFQTGLLGPLNSLINANVTVNVWDIAFVSINELAKQTVTMSEYKSAIRTMYKKYKALENLYFDAQRLSNASSPETFEDTFPLDLSLRMGQTFRIQKFYHCIH